MLFCAFSFGELAFNDIAILSREHWRTILPTENETWSSLTPSGSESWTNITPSGAETWTDIKTRII
jgi:hypothetical protein|tara:strand:- start:414 stop:611 length:198 start_codon:yes stop_codon:yes gene_type:complete